MSLARMSVLAAALALPLASQAATLTFNFVNADGGAGFSAGPLSITGSDGSTTVDVTASNTSGSLTSFVDSAGRGLYVCTGLVAPTEPSCGAGYGDQPHVDGVGYGEMLLLDFGNRRVRLESATFHSSFSGNFDLGVDGTHPVLDELSLAEVVSFAAFAGDLRTGSQFSFAADSQIDWFKLSSITVSEVPLPGSLGLLGLGLAGLGTLRRRKQEA